ncbi:MAG: dihydropteroate synthase [Deltaproteobacteria bacterium]|nr:dihydropteroate synthase [Deltaproteobacteria bacterium]
MRGLPAWLRHPSSLRGRESGDRSACWPVGHRPVVVGVVNVTPDSFSDGGRFLAPDAARARVDRVLQEGADVVEIGGESTRPAGATYGQGYAPVDAATQIARTAPAIEHAVRAGARVAIDTTLPEVARAAVDRGATIVNDVSTLADPALARVCAQSGAWLVLMHARPGAATPWSDLFHELVAEWEAARNRAVAEGVPSDRIVMDPGLGFGKGADDNLRLLAGLPRLHPLGHALFVGPSRKAFIGVCEERDGLEKSPPDERIGGSVAACLAAARAGAAVLRVHDVRALRQALAVEGAIAAASAPAAEVHVGEGA